MTLSAFVPRGRFGYWEKRFAPVPRLRDALLPVFYLNCPDTGPRVGFTREPIYTIMIDLSQSEADLLRACRSNTRNEIGRATKEGTRFAVASDPRRFLALYESMARHTILPPTSADYLKSFGDCVCITEATMGDQLLVSHVYVVDPSIGRARLIRSASVFRDFDKSLQAIAGRANRFLHFQDMLHFRSAGLRCYDLGGYHPPEHPTDKELRNISDFKASFGGSVVQEANYLSLAQFLYRQARKVLAATRQARSDSGSADQAPQPSPTLRGPGE